MNRVNILGEALDGLERWYVAVPPFIIVGFLVVLFFVTGAGQSRLQEAGERIHVSTSRQLAIDELETVLDKAQSGLRGYLLTNDKAYLKPYDEAAAQMEPSLERLRLAYLGSESTSRNIEALQNLIGKRQSEFGVTLALQNGPVPSRSVALLKTNVGENTSKAIADIIGGMRDREALEHNAATAHWEWSLRLSRWVTIAATIFNLLLVGIASRLVYLDMRRRAQQTTQLRDQKLHLEREVEERTRELVALSTHLQGLAEREKASLARELHDELGGLLVGARMDISWAQQHLLRDDSDLKQRLARVQQNLAAGVDLKRRIIEELRPTLLDNVGLFAALRWQLKETCGRAGLKCTETYPDEEPRFASEASIALFRIAQEAFTNILKHSAAKAVDVAVLTEGGNIVLRIADDGKGIPAGRLDAIGSHGLASMRHRTRALGGTFEVASAAAGGTILLARIPAARALAGSADPEPGQEAVADHESSAIRENDSHLP
jgi:signal transduction histidine kinase